MSEKIFSLERDMETVINGYLKSKCLDEIEDLDKKVMKDKVVFDFTLDQLMNLNVLLDIKGKLMPGYIIAVSDDNKRILIDKHGVSSEWFYVDDVKVVDILKQ